MLTVKICILVRFDFKRVCLLGPPEYVLIKSHFWLRQELKESQSPFGNHHLQCFKLVYYWFKFV